MGKIIIYLIILVFFSCVPKGSGIKNPDLTKLNRVLFQDFKTHIFYTALNPCTLNNKPNNDNFECVKSTNNECITDVDLASFKNLGTFWIDKKYFFFLQKKAGNHLAIATPINNHLSGTYFQDSYYRIKNDILEYWGHKWESDSIITCPNEAIIPNIDAGQFHVLKTQEINNNCSINAYAVYKDQFLFHGCWLDFDKIDPELKEALLTAQKSTKAQKEIVD